MKRSAFTLIELLVSISIIVILIGILLPTISHVRRAAYGAETLNEISQISSAIQRYEQDFRAYPGPIPNNQINPYPGYQSGENYDPLINGLTTTTGATADTEITMSENLVLGLFGGLRAAKSTDSTLPGYSASNAFTYDPTLVGGGAMSLSTIGLPKRYSPYMDLSRYLSKGQFVDDGGNQAADTNIPEFVDAYPDPMPILYMRARVGAATSPGVGRIWVNSQNTNATYNGVSQQYDVDQITAYTGGLNNTGRLGDSGKVNGLRYTNSPTASPYPALSGENWTPSDGMDAVPYLTQSSGSVDGKDGFLLISAGPDRIYGTADDLGDK